MKKREKILLIALGAVLVVLGLPKFNAIILAPLKESQNRLNSIKGKLAQTAQEASRIRQAGAALKQWRGRSLPPNPLDAQRLYQAWMTDLAQMAEFKNVKVTPGRRIPRSRVYTGILVSLEGEARLSQLSRFLYHFYRIDLAHRALSLTVLASDSRSDPVLKISLIAEGLAVAGTSPRHTLFAQTKLKADFDSATTKQTIEVTHSPDFPGQPGFRIRIGNEYLRVVAISGTRWTVLGGVDSTRPVKHASEDVVELSPVSAEYADHTLEDFQSLVENSPFVKPAPPSERTPDVNPTQLTVAETGKVDRSEEETYLAASITEDDEPQAWLYRPSNSQRTVIRKGTEFKIGKLEAVVQEIRRDYVLLKSGDSVWLLHLGDTLNLMQQLTQVDTSKTAPGADDAKRPSAPMQDD